MTILLRPLVKTHLLSWPALGFAAVSVLSLGARAAAADARDEEIRALRHEIDALSQRLAALEAAPRPEAPPPAARVVADARGFALRSADDAHQLRLRGLVQADARAYFDAPAEARRDSFVLRRARLIFEGTFRKRFSFQLVPELAGSSTTVLDANVNLAFAPALQLRAGKFKTPTGLEHLQSDSWALFAERAFPSQLLVNRDVGVVLHGAVASANLEYAVGALNGLGDGASSGNSDADRPKEIVGRILWWPFGRAAESPGRKLAVGVAASTTRLDPATGPGAGYRTEGQQTFFRYRSGVVTDGRLTRFAPQANWYAGPFGALAEYVTSSVTVRNGAAGPRTRLRHAAWQLAGSWVLTGEDAAYGGVVPRVQFDPETGGWGAFELTARWSGLDVDDAAFPALADSAASAGAARSFGLGLNWYLNETVRVTADAFHTRFTLARETDPEAAGALLRSGENLLLTRLQLNF